MRANDYRPIGIKAAWGFIFSLLMAACSQPAPVPAIITPVPSVTSTPLPTVAMDPTIASVIAAITLTPQAASPTATVAAAATAITCTPPEDWVRYSVRPLDTLLSLAQRTNSSVAAIKDANCMLDDQIFVGDPLFLPSLPPELPVGGGGGEPLIATPIRELEVALATLDWPIGGPNFGFQPCGVEKPDPWISFETEDNKLDDNITLDPERYDRELGQRSYYFICDFPDPTRIITAQLIWAGGMYELDVDTAVADPRRTMGQAQRVVIWNTICDDPQTFPVATTYTLTVADDQGQQAQLTFALKSASSQRILTVPPAASVGAPFDVYYCGYNNVAGQEVQIDLYHEISYEPAGTFYRIGHNRSWLVYINENGQGRRTLEMLPDDSPRAYFLIDHELILRGWDQFWLVP